MARIVYNKLLRGWYVVRGPHESPLSGRFASHADAVAYLQRRTAWNAPALTRGKA